MPEFEISWIDLAVLVLYVVGTRVFFGWWLSRKASEGAEGYFLAGRNIAWPIIGLSFYVSNMSGSSFVGLPGSGYNTGISVYNYEWVPVAVLIFFLFFLFPQYLAAKIYTAPEFLARRYGRTLRLLFSGFLLLANIFIDAAAALYAGATIAQTLYPGLPLGWIVGVTAMAAGIYIFFGGLGAVVINDALQAVLIFGGGLAICILAWLQIPSWEEVKASAPPEALSLIQPADDPVMPWPGLFGVFLIGLYFWSMNQFVIQRALGAKDISHARRGLLFAGVLKLPNLFILILPGVMATALYPGLENPDLVFPTMAFDLLPIGLRGLMLAALASRRPSFPASRRS
ncbi:MAG: SLC5 family protein [Verrucomicrobiota bacterium]